MEPMTDLVCKSVMTVVRIVQILIGPHRPIFPLTHFLVDTRLKLASNRQSSFFDSHLEHRPFTVRRASQAILAWRQRVQLFARPAFRKSGEDPDLSGVELVLFMKRLHVLLFEERFVMFFIAFMKTKLRKELDLCERLT